MGPNDFCKLTDRSRTKIKGVNLRITGRLDRLHLQRRKLICSSLSASLRFASTNDEEFLLRTHPHGFKFFCLPNEVSSPLDNCPTARSWAPIALFKDLPTSSMLVRNPEIYRRKCPLLQCLGRVCFVFPTSEVGYRFDGSHKGGSGDQGNLAIEGILIKL